MDENLFEEEFTIEFLGIHTVDEIPDEKTVWHVKNILSKAGTFDALFDKSEASASSVPRLPRLSPVSYTTYSDMCKSTNTSRSLLPLWDSRVLTSNNQINEHFREPTMPFEALKPTELIQKVRLPLTNINF